MKIKIKGSDLSTVASTVLKGITKDSSKTYLIVNDDSSLTLLSQSDVSYFKGVIPTLEVQVNENEEKCLKIDGGHLKTILSVMSKDEPSVVFDKTENENIFMIRTTNGNFKLPIMDTNDYVPFTETIETIGTVSPNDFLLGMQNVAKIVSIDPMTQAHPVSCLHILTSVDTLTFFGADNTALIEKNIPIADTNEEDPNLAILIKPAQATLLSTNNISGDSMSLYSTDTMFGYIDGIGVLCLVSKTNMNPLNHKMLINRVSEDVQVMLESDTLKQAIDALARLCPEHSILKFNFDDDGVIISNNNEDTLSILVEDGEKAELGLLKPSLSVLSNVMSNKVKMCWGKEQIDIVLIKNLDDENNVDDSITMVIVNANYKK